MTESKVSEIKSFVTPAEMARELERELRPHVERMIKDTIPYQSIVAAFKDAMPTQIMVQSIVSMANREMQSQIIGLEKKVKELRTREADAKRDAARADRLARDVAEKDREIGRLRGELAAERQTSGGLRLQLDQVRRELNAASGIASNGTTAETWKLEADRANQSNRELTERCQALSAQIRNAERQARIAQAGEQVAKRELGIARQDAETDKHCIAVAAPSVRFVREVVKFIERWKSGHVSGETHARELERWMTEAGVPPADAAGYHPVHVGKYEEPSTCTGRHDDFNYCPEHDR